MEGPVLLRVFSCKDCINLKKAGISSKKPYSCYHEKIVMGKSSPQLMLGDIGSDKITPEFCPFLFKRNRVEKLKLLQSYDER